jgi:hypothetical protein|mmetsp:Transcript_35644/g.56811  ORF Transcript_35644/g.56811 Transcript_35644/m.56811 type:complete len:164 (-) Transcript_35644:295-786(-)|eukprot:CAMPEP_0169167104 /NCGR_PEP_ID=MMETSP1015-20121227/60294_1 /TAXON_ID=342587 /ORGANISM="Karlodinium micrum, Strain CCMP2283" /LENGTH=163 /DNA_ID=CAMNT_0009239793 /DNA_START=59 /DNA_END=550 /DNA_ORIENTATION=+
MCIGSKLGQDAAIQCKKVRFSEHIDELRVYDEDLVLVSRPLQPPPLPIRLLDKSLAELAAGAAAARASARAAFRKQQQHQAHLELLAFARMRASTLQEPMPEPLPETVPSLAQTTKSISDKLQQNVVFCTGCGCSMQTSFKFCFSCGQSMHVACKLRMAASAA